MQTKPVIIGNWKMHKTIQESCAFVKLLISLLQHSSATIGLAVPFTSLSALAEQIGQLQVPLKVGAQNVSDKVAGAYTGEISAVMLKEAGASFSLVGHSERRHLFHEDNAAVNGKVKSLLAEGLLPVVCVGETAQQRERGEEKKVLQEQLSGSLEGLTAAQIGQIILAYEPVWAIGTGEVAHPEDAARAHLLIRNHVASKWGKEIAKRLVILYGGSVKPDNAKQLLEREEVGGFLVGGASLDPHSFQQIITKAER